MTNAFYPTGGRAGVNLNEANATARHELGGMVMGNKGTKWMFVQASTAIAQYDVVGIDENIKANPLTKDMADDGYTIGVAQFAFAASDYGFVALCGRGSDFKVNVLASCSADVKLYTTGTAGKLDDTSTSQTLIRNIAIVSATGTAAAVAAIANHPKSDNF